MRKWVREATFVAVFPSILMTKRLSYPYLLIVCWLLTSMGYAVPLPPSKPVHIEVRHDATSISPYIYFWLTDLYTKEEKKIGSKAMGKGVVALDFELYHPLYDELIPAGNRRLPFYVEPGDTLIIRLGKYGRIESYERRDGTPVRHERLLRHDISNQSFYDEKDFKEDKKQGTFADFVAKVTQKMEVAMDSVNKVADRHAFTLEERNIALCNVQMQFALWIFEYAPFKTSELLVYAERHKGGWQAIPEQDVQMEAIQDIRNYGFMRSLPVNDSTCMASRFFPRFIQSYEHTQVLNYDQYLYYGETIEDQIRMDSAYVAKDLAMTQYERPSLFMDVAMKRKHIEVPPPVNDGSILLKEVEVVGTNLDQFYSVFGKPEGYDPQKVVERAWANDVNLKGSISSLLNRRKIKNYKRAKKIVKELGTDDAEREAIMKAYENMQKK